MTVATNAPTAQPTPNDEGVRRVRTILPRPLYRRLRVQAAREDAGTNAVVVKAVENYLNVAEQRP